METVRYREIYHDEVYQLWRTDGARQGFAPLEREEFDSLLVENPSFQPQHAFVLLNQGKVTGFVCGCAADDQNAGFFSCILLKDGHGTLENTRMLLDALAFSFWETGIKRIRCSYFCPIRLPWVIPGTEGCQHNNAPGIAVDLPLFEAMKKCGYQDRTRECAMYMDLSGFAMPDFLCEKETEASDRGYSVEWYDVDRHTGLKEMVDSMNNSMWSDEIPYAAEHINMLVAVKGREVVGFAGPVYPEKSGRGYFAGIAVSARHEKNGLGTLLFYHLCLEEKRAGSVYMSLFTGERNPARKIYERAGFEVRRVFSIMEKTLGQDSPENEEK